jgi:hypothetical protein
MIKSITIFAVLLSWSASALTNSQEDGPALLKYSPAASNVAKLMKAEELKRKLEPSLLGLTMRAASEQLMQDGFACGLVLADEVFDVPPKLTCEMASGGPSPCESYSLNLYADWTPAPRRSLFLRMGKSAVSKVTAFCPYPFASAPSKPDSAPIQNDVAKQYSGSLNLHDKPYEQVIEELFSRGFSCQYERSAGIQSRHLLCRLTLSWVEGCPMISISVANRGDNSQTEPSITVKTVTSTEVVDQRCSRKK